MAQTPTVSGPPQGGTASGMAGTAPANPVAQPHEPGWVSGPGRGSEPGKAPEPGSVIEPGVVAGSAAPAPAGAELRPGSEPREEPDQEGSEPGAGPEPQHDPGPRDTADARTPAGPGCGGGRAGESAPPRRRGMRGTGLDMLRSLGLLLVVVAVVWFVSGMGHSDTRGQASVADWQRSVAALPAAVGFDLEAPGEVPAGWAVTALRVAGTGSWTMTVTTSHSHYIDLLQTAGDPATVQAAVLPDAAAAGRVRVGTTRWSVFVLPGDERGNPRRALVRAVPGAATRPAGASAASGSASGSGVGPAPATVVVLSGTASAAELDTFAASLRTVT